MKASLSALLIAMAATASLASDVIWETRWDWSTPPYSYQNKYSSGNEGPVTVAGVEATPDGGALVHETYFANGSHKTGSWHQEWSIFSKVSSGGTLAFYKQGIGAHADQDGSVFVIDGSWEEYIPYGFSFSGLRKFSATGTQLWTVLPPGAYGHSEATLAVIEDGRSYITYRTDFEYSTSLQRVRLDCYNTAGSLAWSYDFPLESLFANTLRDYRVSVKPDGNIAVTALHNSGVQIYTFTPEGQDLGSVTLPSGRVSFGTDSSIIFWSGQTLRMYSTTGTLLWERTAPATILNVASDHSFTYTFLLDWPKTIVHTLNGTLVREITVPVTPSNPVPATFANADGIGNCLYRWRLGGTTLKENYRLTRALGVNEVFTALASGIGINSDRFEADFDATGVTLKRRHSGIDRSVAAVVRGTSVENSHYALNSSSDGYWGLRPGVTLSTQQAPISIVLDHVAPLADPTEMGVIVESRASSTSVAQTVEIYNFQTSSWTQLESVQPLTAGVSPDRYVVLDVANPGSHVGPGRVVRVRLEYRATGPMLSYPWTVRIDREMLRYRF